MLRPEQMSKVSVTGSKSVMDEVIETMHEMHLVHITDYDGSWDGFEPGTPLEGSDETSSQLVTVRAIESTLGVTPADAGSTAAVDLSDADERLEEIRTEVNELDDRRDELRGRLRDIDDKLDQMTVFADLGLELDLLWGYDSLDVMVGEGDGEAVQEALEESDDVEAYDIFTGGNTVAAFGYLDDGSLEDTLVGVPFTEYDVPEEAGNPTTVVSDLKQERQQVEAELSKLESEIEALKLDSAAFLLALEEKLSIDAQKFEAPLRFATTERSFVVEGWVPTESIDEFEQNMRAAVGDRIDIDEIERASYTSGGHVHKETHGDEHSSEADTAEAATDGGTVQTTEAESGEQQVATDGGTAQADGGREIVTVDDSPPVIQKNSKMVGPFEVLVKAVNRPKYSELDPTLLVFMTFPFFFGFMIGDMGYGVLYVALGYYMAKNFDSQGIRDFGMVVVWLGLWTFLFGILYGELFGHYIFQSIELFASVPSATSYQVIDKGIVTTEWAITWLIVAVLFGWIQLNIGYIFNFIEEYQLHGAKEAVVESGSWILMLNGIWVFIFSEFGASSKPDFLVGEEAVFAAGSETIPLGFSGFPELVGILGLVAFAIGIVLILTGPWYEVFEFLTPLVHVLSYTRLTAVLLSKAGMAVAANLLYFGAALGDGSFEFFVTSQPTEDAIFQGLYNMGTMDMSVAGLEFALEGAILGLPVLIIGHIVVLAIGGTAALQAIRLEYVEFFGKFYEGGGKNYQPFGYERTYTTDN